MVGGLVALAGTAWVWLWSPTSARAVRKFATGGQVRAVAFGPDGRHLIGVGAFGELHRWRVADGQTVRTCPALAGTGGAPQRWAGAASE